MNLYRGFDAEPLLLDTNYLSGLFRRELSEAVERIFVTSSQSEFEAAEYSLAASPGKVIS
jgi:hypothetical protein